jgi:hypothetical protein
MYTALRCGFCYVSIKCTKSIAFYQKSEMVLALRNTFVVANNKRFGLSGVESVSN